MTSFRWKNIAAGAVGGIGACLAYAMIEFLLLSVAPLLRLPGTEWGRPFWHESALLLVGYAVLGALLGAVIGALLGPRAEDFPDREILAPTLLLTIVFAANLLASWPLSGGESISTAVATVLAIFLIASLQSLKWRTRLRFLTGPLVVSALLFVPPWIGNDILAGRSGAWRAGVILAVLLGIVACSFLLHRIRTLTWTPLRYALTVVGALGVTCAVGLALNPRSPQLPARKTVAPAGRPNVILIVMDTVRADHTSLYGYDRDTTPYLSELAKEATLYKRSFAVSDFTLPTHASMFTGLYPRTHGAYFAPPNYPGGRPLSPRFTTMAEILQTNGYRTAGIVANAGYLNPGMGFAKGFELYDWRSPVSAMPRVQTYYLRQRLRGLLDRFVSTADFEVRSRRAEEINQNVYGFLDQVDAPFFLFVNYMDAHNPYVPPAPFDRRYPCPDPTIGFLESSGRVYTQVLSGEREIQDEERVCLTAGYDGGIAYMDSQIRELVRSLRARGLYDNSLLIITSDHGEALGRRNQLRHAGISAYQNEIGVPLLVKYPGAKSGGTVNADAAQVDLLPTVLDVLSIVEPPGLQGISLRTLEREPSRFVVSVSYPHQALVDLNPKYARTETAVILGDKKLIESSSGERELFDLSRDRDEDHNLYHEDPSDTLSLTHMLDQWIHDTPAAAAEDLGAVDRNTVERLKSLGYAQ